MAYSVVCTTELLILHKLQWACVMLTAPENELLTV